MNLDVYGDEYGYAVCPHGIYKGLVGGYCDECDEYEAKRGGLDQCLRCGRYCWGDELNESQVHKRGCVHPQEHL